jgi:hypothetical protein
MGTGKRRISTGAQLEGLRRPIDLAALELGLPIGPVAALELVIDLAAVELGLPIGPAAALEPVIDLAAVELGLPIGPALVPELETAQVVALELELVQVAVALRTRSATTAQRPDLVPVLTAEDLAAAAETTRAPAVAEAAKAWEVAE